MKYYGELTKKLYETEEECEKAEQAFKLEQEKKEAEALQKSKARKEAAKKVEDAYSAMIAAKKAYAEELAAFCHEYGSFHMTVNKDDTLGWMDDFWESWF